jgi:acyl-CoA reductase-like NAD-dependent aldehyde dehydrogenase
MGLLEPAVKAVSVGDPGDEASEMGPLISADHREKVASYVTDDAPVAFRGSAPDGAGFWFAPTVLAPTTPDHPSLVEEIFGPVVSVLTFRTQAEAIEKANSTPYGLAAGIWTDKGSKAFEVASALQAGVVWQNTYNKFDPSAAFGGYKESGFGREGGMSGLRPYLRVAS